MSNNQSKKAVYDWSGTCQPVSSRKKLSTTLIIAGGLAFTTGILIGWWLS